MQILTFFNYMCFLLQAQTFCGMLGGKLYEPRSPNLEFDRITLRRYSFGKCGMFEVIAVI